MSLESSVKPITTDDYGYQKDSLLDAVVPRFNYIMDTIRTAILADRGLNVESESDEEGAN